MPCLCPGAKHAGVAAIAGRPEVKAGPNRKTRPRNGSKRRVGKGANRRAHQALREAPMSAIGGSRSKAGVFFFTLAFADHEGNATELSGRFGE